MKKRKREVRIQSRAREIAATARHINWCYVLAELRSRTNAQVANDALSSQAFREELDRICAAARVVRRGLRIAGNDGTSKTSQMQRARLKQRVNLDQKRALKAADLRLFVQQYARPAQKGSESNDRRYSLEIEQAARRMKPMELDRLLRDDEGKD